MTVTKSQISEILQTFSGEEIDPEKLMYRIYVLKNIVAGVSELDKGKGILHEEVFAKYGF